MTMEIKRFAADIHKTAVEHGWWDGGERNFGELIALCHSELSEALEEYRNGRKPTETYYECKAGEHAHASLQDIHGCGPAEEGCKNSCNGHYGKPCGIPSELADVVIRIFDMCGHYGIDIEAILEEKAAFNATRPYRHGGKVI